MFETTGVGRGGIISLGESRIGRGLGDRVLGKTVFKVLAEGDIFPRRAPRKMGRQLGVAVS